MADETRKFDALAAPPSALERGGSEALRAAIAAGGLHVSLIRGFDDAAVWGILLADIARHASRSFAKEDGLDEDETIAAIRSMFNAEIDKATDPGTTSAVN
jgi:Domain of unknown function (DUF5076)